MDASILNVSLTLSSELFAEIGGVLILDVLNDRIPTSVVIHLVTISGGINDIQS